MCEYAKICAQDYRPKFSITRLNTVNKRAQNSPKSFLLKIRFQLFKKHCLQACVQNWIKTDEIVRGRLACGSMKSVKFMS